MIYTDNDRRVLQDRFEKELIRRVYVKLYTSRINCRTCGVAAEWLVETAKLNKLIVPSQADYETEPDEMAKVRVVNFPVVSVRQKKAEQPNIFYYGVPSGRQSIEFLHMLVWSSRRRVPIQAASAGYVAEVGSESNIVAYVIPTCHHSQKMVSTLYKAAVMNSNIQLSVIDALAFPQLAKMAGVREFPYVFMNDRIHIIGNKPEEEVMYLLQESSRPVIELASRSVA